MLNSTSLAAKSAAASALFTSMIEGAFEDRLVRDRPDLLDALLDLLRTDLTSSSLRDAADSPQINSLSSVWVRASHLSIF